MIVPWSSHFHELSAPWVLVLLRTIWKMGSYQKMDSRCDPIMNTTVSTSQLECNKGVHSKLCPAKFDALNTRYPIRSWMPLRNCLGANNALKQTLHMNINADGHLKADENN